MKTEATIPGQMLGMQDLAKYLSLTYGYVRHWSLAADFPFSKYKIGRKTTFRKEEVDNWLENSCKVKTVTSMAKN